MIEIVRWQHEQSFLDVVKSVRNKIREACGSVFLQFRMGV